MKEKHKNRKSNLSDFLRYSAGNMTDKERNAFEKELQKDPFAEEAAEGFSEMSPDNIAKDLADMNNQLKKRISGRRRITFYQIAASVAVLIIIASQLYIIERNKAAKELRQISMNQVTLDIPESKALTEPSAEKQKPEPSEHSPLEGKTESPVRQAARKKQEEAVAVPEVRSAADKKSEQTARSEIKAADEIIQDRRIAAPAAVASREIPKIIQARGEIISSEDNLPIAGANISIKGTTSGVLTDTRGKFSITIPDEKHPTLVAGFIGMEPKEFQVTTDTEMVIKLYPSSLALNEVVVVGYGTDKKSNAVQAGYSPPEPEAGMKNFDNYIEKNILNPGTLPSGQKAIVIVRFTVRSTGTIDSLKIIRSPGTEFSREALRLIREGPAWKPAVSDGEKIDDEVRVRIVFR